LNAQIIPIATAGCRPWHLCENNRTVDST